MQNVVLTIKSIIDDANKNNLLQESEFSLGLTEDINKSLNVKKIDTGGSSSAQNQLPQSHIINSETRSDLSKNSFDSVFNSINNLFVDKLITYIVKKLNEGYTFNQVQQLINQKISEFNQFNQFN